MPTTKRKVFELDKRRTVLACEIGLSDEPEWRQRSVLKKTLGSTWVEKIMTKAGKEGVMMDWGFKRMELKCVKKYWEMLDNNPVLVLHYFSKDEDRTFEVRVNK